LAVAGVWLSGFAIAAAAALLPRKGQVSPDGARAGRAAIAVALGAIVLGLCARVESPTETTVLRAPRAALGAAAHCLGISGLLAALVLVAAVLALRKVVLGGAWRVGAAAGAAGGAVGGLTLHFACGFGGVFHLAVAHGGGVVLGALMGGLLVPPLLRP
jgi:hypothetical protein